MPGAPFVLVHGGWHGAWCWDRLRPWLSAAGARVVAPDLPGHGEDRTPLARLTPTSSVERVADAVRAEDAPVVLVGHSSGGMLVSAVGDLLPERIAALVYVSAFLLPAGVTPPAVMRDDGESLLPSSLVVDGDGRTASLRREDARQVFYADCDDEVANWALDRLQPEPRVVGTPPTGQASTSPFLDLPRFYVECTKDRALGPRT
ncbi:MAG: alpha/beta fold hydrolase, partial [Candidatus Dormibacteraeota bacterium]|nr:alpha/beta fold hydrolase [Candidatus Dormibacteraeota bacterium]MBO0762579.1 alpha/beta fold hydrolase [Candidatus Dormibacteraeota bacterium]